jgi:hypothetical protein
MSVRAPRRRDFGADLDAAMRALGRNYHLAHYRRTGLIVAEALSELFGPVVEVHIPSRGGRVGVRMAGLASEVMNASPGYIGVSAAASRAATARGIDLRRQVQALVPNWVEIDGEERDGRQYPDAPWGFTVWHPINGRHWGSRHSRGGARWLGVHRMLSTAARHARQVRQLRGRTPLVVSGAAPG